VLLSLVILVEVYLEVPHLLIIGGDPGSTTLAEVRDLLRLALLVTPLEEVLLQVEISLLISIEVALLLEEALDRDLGGIYGYGRLHRLLRRVTPIRVTELRGQIIVLNLWVR
jgi:hypothetical protein